MIKHQKHPIIVKKLLDKHLNGIYEIINRSAQAYEGVIPEDYYHQPYMPMEELRREMKSMAFFGCQQENKLIGVMGFQPVKDVTLIRHAYILPAYQRKGIGGKLLNHLKGLTRTKYLLVGTWADASRAIQFYLNQGFRFMPGKDTLLREYWNISERQIETSIVLGMRIK